MNFECFWICSNLFFFWQFPQIYSYITVPPPPLVVINEWTFNIRIMIKHPMTDYSSKKKNMNRSSSSSSPVTAMTFCLFLFSSVGCCQWMKWQIQFIVRRKTTTSIRFFFLFYQKGRDFVIIVKKNSLLREKKICSVYVCWQNNYKLIHWIEFWRSWMIFFFFFFLGEKGKKGGNR